MLFSEVTGSIWMPLRANFQYTALEGKCLVQVRQCSELLETGKEVKRDGAQ